MLIIRIILSVMEFILLSFYLASDDYVEQDIIYLLMLFLVVVIFITFFI